MSRRTGRGGRPRHPDHRGGPRPHDPTRVARPASQGSTAALDAEPIRPAIEVERPDARSLPVGADLVAASEAVGAAQPGPEPVPAGPLTDVPMADALEPTAESSAMPVEPTAAAWPPGERHGTCTTAQLRRFIKSRAYIPLHEIRRRFLIATEDDDVTAIDLATARIFVGLPEREGHMLGELLRGGEVGYELQLDPVSPIVVGVYPMRPVTRG